MHRFLVHARQLVAAFVLLTACLSLPAQSGTSSVEGTVSDPTGAVLPGAAVVLTNTATNVVLKSVTDSSGTYSFPSVSPGVYSLAISNANFASYRVSQFQVIVGQHATENAKLSPASSTTVNVDASGLSNLIDPQSNDLGTVIGPQSVEQLPLNNRNFLQLGLLSGAAQVNAGAASGSVAETGHPSV